MPYSSLEREKKILELLQTQGSTSIQELVEALNVSNMTIHRDLNKMEQAGHIQKKHGGVTLVDRAIVSGEYACSMCNKPVSERTVFIVQFENGEQKRACCAHCGLMIHSQAKDAWQSLTADYLYGHMVSANQAIYVIGSELNVCCVPSVLSFGSQKEAEKFQAGFGGHLFTMEEAVAHLHRMMHAHK